MDEYVQNYSFLHARKIIKTTKKCGHKALKEKKEAL